MFLPGGADGEMDIEGLAVERLTFFGSSARARASPSAAEGATTTPQALARLAEVRDDPNRRLPRPSHCLTEPSGGGPADLGAEPPMRAGEGRLLDLEGDPYLGRFAYSGQGERPRRRGAGRLRRRPRLCRPARAGAARLGGGARASLRTRLPEPPRAGADRPPPAGPPARWFSTSAALACASWRRTAGACCCWPAHPGTSTGRCTIHRWGGALAVAGDSLVRADELGPPVLSPASAAAAITQRA